ncbi:MAG: hypothetical protein AB2A00_13815 [Myxococcota bacterium]
MDVIDVERMLSLRPASVRPRLFPDEALLPLSPVDLLPALTAPLLEVPAALGPYLPACFRAAQGVDAPLAVAVDGVDASERARSAGLHEAVGQVLELARQAAFLGPWVIHARLGVVDAEDESLVDHARVAVMAAMDAGATSVEMGVFGDAEVATPLLADMLRPAAENGLGVVVRLLDAHQAEVMPEALRGTLPVSAYVVGPGRAELRRRDALAARPQPPFPTWADGTAVMEARVRKAFRDRPAPSDARTLFGEAAALPEADRERLEALLYAETEELLETLRAKGSAGRAMVRLSHPED